MLKKNKGINWNLVHYFYVVASCGSIKGASKTLSLSASTLSEHISQLEKQLKVKLFHRKRHGLDLTSEGVILFHHASRMFDVAQQLTTLDQRKKAKYPVSIALAPCAVRFHVSKVIAEFTRNYDSSVNLHHPDHQSLERGLLDTTYDIGFSCYPPESAELAYFKIAASSLAFFVSKTVGSRTFSDLIQNQPLLLCKYQGGARSSIEANLTEIGYQGLTIVTSEFPGVLLDLCLLGHGMGIFTEDLVYHSSAQLLLDKVAAPKGIPSMKLNLYLLWPKARETEAVLDMKDISSCVLTGKEMRVKEGEQTIGS